MAPQINLLSKLRKPKFKLGQLVRHRASGEKGVIAEAKTYCVVHPDHRSYDHRRCRGGLYWPGPERFDLSVKPVPCHAPQEFGGYYSLKTAIDKIEHVNEREIELVPPALIYD